MNVLIIGCGYVGQRAAQAWLSEGHSVSALTRNAENATRLAAQGITPILGDVTRPASLIDLPAADLVLYAVGFDRSAAHSQRDVYVDGLANVLAEIHARTGRLIYLSSTSVYGQTGGEWVDESSPCEPIRDNGQVCLDAEQVIKSQLGGDSTAEFQILRLAGIYGPNRLLARVAALRDGEPLAGNPEGYLNLIHVEDIVRTILACAERGVAGQTYLVSDDRPITRRAYYETLAQLIGAAAPQFGGSGSGRHGAESLNKRCKNRRLRDELAVELAYPTIETGLPAALGDLQ
ncbi:SDR family oxidoreductase [Symmachiella dynata]|uniref:SDR family oxidoreductase n=1 Tax=Symmachiella dynata TaxID=2527995 RepID=UPI0030EB3CB9